MYTMRLFCTLALSAALSACTTPTTEQAKSAPPTHQTRFVAVADSIKLEVLDWGGTGKPLLFLAGLGGTAHAFCDFALQFTDEYHVYALTRRGFGQSSVPEMGYDMKTLAHDVLVVLDSLHIPKVLLAGHSIAGDEMSMFASSYPDRVEKMVYLDAAHDRVGLDSLLGESPNPPKPTAKDSASLATYQQYVKATFGTLIPLEEMRQTCIVAKNGRYVGDKTPGFVYGSIINGMVHPDYAHVRCPALAIYAELTSFKDAPPFFARLDSVNKTKAAASFSRVRQWQRTEMNRFRNEVAHGTVQSIKGAQHAIYVSHPKETEQMMRAFLK